MFNWKLLSGFVLSSEVITVIKTVFPCVFGDLFLTYWSNNYIPPFPFPPYSPPSRTLFFSGNHSLIQRRKILSANSKVALLFTATSFPYRMEFAKPKSDFWRHNKYSKEKSLKIWWLENRKELTKNTKPEMKTMPNFEMEALQLHHNGDQANLCTGDENTSDIPGSNCTKTCGHLPYLERLGSL